VPDRREQPDDRVRVRHITTGDVGTVVRVDRFRCWTLVRWDGGGPGMCDQDGLSYVAPGLLERA
jgi:hypothetical protein